MDAHAAGAVLSEMRPVFLWSGGYETGLQEVDQQHRKLVDMLNGLGKAFANGAGRDELLGFVDHLAEYAVYHFQTEETLMAEYGVQTEHRKGHERSHRDFAHQVVAARQLVEQRASEAIPPLLTFLSKWLLMHILGVDRRMAAEILALRDGASASEAMRRAENTMADVSGVLLQAMNGLYEDLAARSHEAMEANRRLQVEVAERARAEESLQARMREMECLYRCSEVLQSRGLSIEKVLSAFLNCLVEYWPWGREHMGAVIECSRGQFHAGAPVAGLACLEMRLRVDGEDYGWMRVACAEDSVEVCEACEGQSRSNLLEQITARVSGYLERALSQEVRRKLWLAVEQSPVSIVITDRRGVIEYANPHFCKLTGYSRDEVLGRVPSMLKSGQTPPEVYADLWHTISSGVTWHGELLNRKRDGSLYWEDVTITPVFDGGGLLTHYLGVKEDITERRAAESALRSSKADLERALTDLSASNDQLAELARMSDMIQSCADESEVLQVIRQSCERLMSEGGGALALRYAEGGDFETRLEWGSGARNAPAYRVEDCWALRRGQPHDSHAPAGGPCCEHLLRDGPEGVRCIPLVVAGKTLGALTLGRPEGPSASWERLASNLADAIKMSLSNFYLRDALRAQALHDPLTGLYNRRFFDETLRRTLLRSARTGEPCALVLLDIDHFKRFNDTYGHEAGDAVLKGVAGCLMRHARESDLVCRIGGEELAVLMPGADEAQAAERAGMWLAQMRELQVEWNGQKLPPVSSSAGVASAIGLEAGAGALARNADLALYEAKRLGRDQVVVSSALSLTH